MPKSYKPQVQTDTTGKWYDNQLRFKTYEEALSSAQDLMSRWSLVIACQAVPSEDEPNFRWSGVGLSRIPDSA